MYTVYWLFIYKHVLKLKQFSHVKHRRGLEWVVMAGMISGSWCRGGPPRTWTHNIKDSLDMKVYDAEELVRNQVSFRQNMVKVMSCKRLASWRCLVQCLVANVTRCHERLMAVSDIDYIIQDSISQICQEIWQVFKFNNLSYCSNLFIHIHDEETWTKIKTHRKLPTMVTFIAYLSQTCQSFLTWASYLLCQL